MGSHDGKPAEIEAYLDRDGVSLRDIVVLTMCGLACASDGGDGDYRESGSTQRG